MKKTSEVELSINNEEISSAAKEGARYYVGDPVVDFMALIPAGLAYCRMKYVNGEPDDFVYLYTNSAFHAQTGLGSVSGKYVTEIIPGIKDSSPDLFEIYGRVALSGISENFETYVEAFQHWYSVQVFSPKPEHFVAIFDDITSRKITEAKLREKEHLLSESQRVSHAGSWQFELAGNLSWSEETYRIYGVSPDTFTPNFESLSSVIHSDDKQAMHEWRAACMAGNKPNALEFRIRRPDGSIRTLRSYGELVYDSQNKPLKIVGIVHDISASVVAEKQIRNLMQEQKAIIESDVVGIAKLSNRTISWASTAFTKMLGYLPEELIGHPTRILYPSDQTYTDLGKKTYQAIQKGEIFKAEIELVSKDGTMGWYQICCGLLNQEDNDLIVSCVDVTERKRLDLALAQSEERYRGVVEDQTEIICRIRMDGTVIFANEVYCRFFCMPITEVIGTKWHPVAYTEDIPIVEAQLQLLSIDNPVVDIENRVYSGRGELRWMHFVNRGFFDANNQLIEIQAVGRDITQRKEAEIALRETKESLKSLARTQAKHLQELAADLTQAEQHERDDLYELLHDDVQPMLVAARLALNGISEHTQKEKISLLKDKANEHITHVIEVTRSLSRHLSPPLIRERGLIPAMESLFNWMNDNLGLKVEFVSKADTMSIDLSLRYLIFNSTRELLMNVVKHAKTRQAKVMVASQDNNILDITVADQGRGFDTKLIRNGTGLSKIEQRLDMFGGSIKIESQLKKGTLVTMLIPITKLKVGKKKHGSKPSLTENHE